MASITRQQALVRGKRIGPAEPHPPNARTFRPHDTLYGTTYNGATSVIGMVFRMNPDSTGFTTLHDSSTGTSMPVNLVSNYDGCNPRSEVLLAEHTLYGTIGIDVESGTGVTGGRRDWWRMGRDLCHAGGHWCDDGTTMV